MTYEELLARIDLQEARWSDERTYKALRAVVELHKPIDDNSCHHCATWYPCPTIQAIEKELNEAQH